MTVQNNSTLLKYLLSEIRNNSFDETINNLVPVEPTGDQHNQIFFHLGSVNKLGINPETKYDTPLGVYAYPLTSEYKQRLLDNELPFAQTQPYIQLFKLKPDSRLFIVQSYTAYTEDYQKLLSWATQQPQIGNKLFQDFVTSVRRAVAASFTTTLESINGITNYLKSSETDSIAVPEVLHSRDQLNVIVANRYKEIASQHEIDDDDLPKFMTEFDETLTILLKGVLKDMPTIITKKQLEKVLVSKFFVKVANQAKQKTEAGEIWNISRMLAQNLVEQRNKSTDKTSTRSHIAWTMILKNVLGYTAAIDYGLGLIHSNEPTQAVVFDPRSIVRLETVYNKYGHTDPTLPKKKENVTQATKSTKKISTYQLERIKYFFDDEKTKLGFDASFPFTTQNFAKFMAVLPTENLLDVYQDDQFSFLFLSSIIPHEPSDTEKYIFDNQYSLSSLYTIFHLINETPSIGRMFEPKIKENFVRLMNQYNPKTLNSTMATINFIKQATIKVKNKSLRDFFVSSLKAKLPPMPSLEAIVNTVNGGNDDLLRLSATLGSLNDIINNVEDNDVALQKEYQFYSNLATEGMRQGLQLTNTGYKVISNLTSYNPELTNIIWNWYNKTN